MSHVWNGGHRAYGHALQQEYRDAVDKLRAQLQSANSDRERQEIEEQIVRLTENYREKLRASHRSLF